MHSLFAGRFKDKRPSWPTSLREVTRFPPSTLPLGKGAGSVELADLDMQQACAKAALPTNNRRRCGALLAKMATHSQGWWAGDNEWGGLRSGDAPRSKHRQRDKPMRQNGRVCPCRYPSLMSSSPAVVCRQVSPLPFACSYGSERLFSLIISQTWCNNFRPFPRMPTKQPCGSWYSNPRLSLDALLSLTLSFKAASMHTMLSCWPSYSPLLGNSRIQGFPQRCVLLSLSVVLTLGPLFLDICPPPCWPN